MGKGSSKSSSDTISETSVSTSTSIGDIGLSGTDFVAALDILETASVLRDQALLEAVTGAATPAGGAGWVPYSGGSDSPVLVSVPTSAPAAASTSLPSTQTILILAAVAGAGLLAWRALK